MTKKQLLNTELTFMFPLGARHAFPFSLTGKRQLHTHIYIHIQEQYTSVAAIYLSGTTSQRHLGTQISEAVVIQ